MRCTSPLSRDGPILSCMLARLAAGTRKSTCRLQQFATVRSVTLTGLLVSLADLPDSLEALDLDFCFVGKLVSRSCACSRSQTVTIVLQWGKL